MLAKIAQECRVKVPLTRDGLNACGADRRGHQTNVTLCFSAGQAMLAAKAGATFISPFIGRLDDIGADGMELIREIRADLRQLRLRRPRSWPPRSAPSATSRCSARRRRCRDHAARSAQGPLQAPVNRQGARNLPRRLGQDGPEDRLIQDFKFDDFQSPAIAPGFFFAWFAILFPRKQRRASGCGKTSSTDEDIIHKETKKTAPALQPNTNAQGQSP